MSVSPVQSYNAAIEPAGAPAQEPRPRPKAPDPVSVTPIALPGSGKAPEPEGHDLKNAASASQFPEDEVQLQRDQELQNELIVRYVDRAGNLIVQIPSEQTLNFLRAVAAEFEKARTREAAAMTESATQKGAPHGH